MRDIRAILGGEKLPLAARHTLCAILFLLLAVPGITDVLAQQLPTAIPQTKWAGGQDVVPYFDGWIRNPDGSFDLVFGYFNRNWQQELAIPVGPDNIVEPGGPDRGQPTYFLPRRQGWVFRVRVPKDFGTQVVTWTVTANGKTQKAYGELLPVEEITERIVMARGNLNPGDDDPNKPPAVTIAQVEGPSVGAPVSLIANVTDDGLPKPRAAAPRPTTTVSDPTRFQAQRNSNATGRPRGLTVAWMQLRGPAKVTFEPTGAIPVAEGKAAITARFAEAGRYVLRAIANDGSLSTRADVAIAVQAAKTQNPEVVQPRIESTVVR